MNHLQRTTSNPTGITPLVLSLAIVAIALSVVAPKHVSLDPLGRAPSPYVAAK